LTFDPLTSTNEQIDMQWSLLTTSAEVGGAIILNYQITFYTANDSEI